MLAVAHSVDRVAVCDQNALDRVRDSDLVFHDQDPQRSSSCPVPD